MLCINRKLANKLVEDQSLPYLSPTYSLIANEILIEVYLTTFIH